MRAYRFVSTVVLVAFVSATIPHTANAAPGADGMPTSPAPQSSPLRRSIDRVSAVAAAQLPGVPLRQPRRVRRQMTGGRGSGGMMMMTLLMTAASLAGTYFLVKELKKSTDEASNSAR